MDGVISVAFYDPNLLRHMLANRLGISYNIGNIVGYVGNDLGPFLPRFLSQTQNNYIYKNTRIRYSPNRNIGIHTHIHACVFRKVYLHYISVHCGLLF